jgi:hypothetical protein
MLLGDDWSEKHPQSQSLFLGQFFGLMNNPGYLDGGGKTWQKAGCGSINPPMTTKGGR